MMNNNEARLTDLTNGILLIKRLMNPTKSTTQEDMEKSEYYDVYINLIKERNQLLKELNREECRI